MKKSLISALVIGTSALLGGEAMAQAGNTAIGAGTATANVISPIAITSTAALDFGDVIPGVGAGTVSMSNAGVRSTGGDATLGSVDVGNAGAFTVTGASGYAYSIALPASIPVTGPAAAAMTVTVWNSNPSGNGLLTGGTQQLLVGAMLSVGAGQPVGAYTGPYNVTVAYN
jgi:uncharacterized protein DUF4402